MNQTVANDALSDLNRRGFVQRSSFAAMLGAVELRVPAQAPAEKKATFHLFI